MYKCHFNMRYSVKGQKKHLTDDAGETPLHNAARFGHIEICEYLICRLWNETGVVSFQNQLEIVHPVDDHGNTPFSIACEKGHDEVSSFLFFRHPF